MLKETYRVKSFDKMYTGLCRLPIKNIITLNIDNLVERIYEDESSTKIIADNNITGQLEKTMLLTCINCMVLLHIQWGVICLSQIKN